MPPHTRTMVLSCPAAAHTSLDRARRDFARALTALEAVIPQLEAPRLGVCVARARGPARYYGSETAAAQTLLEAITQQGYSDARVGVANSRFIAEHVTRTPPPAPYSDTTTPGICIIPSDATDQFLVNIPLHAAEERYTEVIALLTQLGVRTFGTLARLSADAVAERFGILGRDLHDLARGRDPRSWSPASPLLRAEHRRVFAFDVPLTDADQLAFASRLHAQQFVRELENEKIVCTELGIDLLDDEGVIHARTWSHPSHFTEFDIVNRVRWQAETLPRNVEHSGAGIVEVTLTAVRSARAADHEPGLWNTTPDERINHHLGRIQHLVSHEGVCTAELVGGRLSADRWKLIPWGAASQDVATGRPRSGPWPGALTETFPSMVFSEPLRVALFDARDHPVRVTCEHTLTAPPAKLATVVSRSAHPHTHAHSNEPPCRVQAWSALWPLREHWWRDDARLSYRMQVVTEQGDAWLLRYEHQNPELTPALSTLDASGWVAEGRYD